MNIVLLFKAIIILSTGIFFIPKKGKIVYSILLQTILIGLTSTWAIQALQSNDPITIDLGIPFWSGVAVFIIDKLAAFFILLINFTCITGAIYGSGYLQPYLNNKGEISMSLHVLAFFMLHVSMLHVVMMRDGYAFLMAWELMSVFSFVLVIFDGEKEGTLKTGINYLIQMHAGFLCLLLGLLIVNNYTGLLSFDALTIFFKDHNNVWLFLLFFAGFGIKAGFIPFHTWLPHAHPAAPSHVSGVMSGIMIKMGIYGILRVLTQVQSQHLEIGIIIFSIGIVTAIIGILYAVFQQNLKKTLAYSSIENIGIIGIGMGIGLIGIGLENEILTILGFTGAMLHILNHSLYKSMLFYTAGNVYYTTHTLDLNKLGGLAKFMPYSSAIFMIGSLAICAIPPLNGFMSEYLLYSSAFQNIASSGFTTSILSLGILLSLVVVGGLSVYCFTKTFGITFLGSKRSPSKIPIKEVPLIMWVPQLVIITVMLAVSVMPLFFIQQVTHVLSVFRYITIHQGIIAEAGIGLVYVSYGNGILMVIFGLIVIIKRIQHSRRIIQEAPTWGCGYSAGDFRHQYTSTSYAESLRELTSGVVAVKSEKPIFEETEIFPSKRHFETSTHDLMEEKVVLKPVNYFIKKIQKGSVGQTGMINHYLAYPLAFLILIGLLTILGIL